MYFNQQIFIKYILYVMHFARSYKSACDWDPLSPTSYIVHLGIHWIIETLCVLIFYYRKTQN